jgi:hypothetical protein
MTMILFPYIKAFKKIQIAKLIAIGNAPEGQEIN